MKKSTYFITTLLTIVGISLTQAVLPAFAQDTLGGQKLINQVNHMQNQASRSANKSANELKNIISHADTMIANRLTSLNTLLTRLQGDKRLSASEISSLTSDIQKNISGLTALKTKIDADTDVTTAHTDAKQIINNYYVYAVFEPKVRLLITLNNLQTVSLNVQALVPQLQNLINTFKSQGKDVSQLQPLLDDISTQLNTINTTLTSDITTVQNISTTTKRDPSTFSKVRQDISQLVKTGFAKIRSDFEKMLPLFRQIIGNHLTPTPSGTNPTSTSASLSSPSPTK